METFKNGLSGCRFAEILNNYPCINFMDGGQFVGHDGQALLTTRNQREVEALGGKYLNQLSPYAGRGPGDQSPVMHIPGTA